MPVTTSPTTEACDAIVARINSGTAYNLQVKAQWLEQITEPLETLDETRVDVVPEAEEQLLESLAVEDYTNHLIRVWIRRKLNSLDREDIEAAKLLVRKLWQRLNNYDTTDRRVMVWEASVENQEMPDKQALRESGLFIASILLRVEVAPSG